MKIKAFILLLSIAVNYVDIMAAVKACEMIKQKTSCCKKNCSKKQAPAKCPSSSSNDCSKNCIVCPQAYITIISSSAIFNLGFILLSTRFPEHQVNTIIGFYTKAWKPPNAISFS